MRRLAIIAAAIGLAISACGSSGTSDASKSALVNALSSLQSSPHTVTFTIDSTPGSLHALSHGKLTTADATKILSSSLIFEGNNESDPAKALARIALNVGGREDFEMRVINQVIYLHADVGDLLSTFGQDPAKAAQAARKASAHGLSFVQDVVDGKWIALQGLAQLQQQFGAQTPAPQALDNLRSTLPGALRAGVTSVTKEGNDAAGTHYVATISLRKAYDALVKSFQSVLPQLSQGGLTSTSVPDTSFKVDTWIKNGDVTQIEFDLLQLADLSGTPAPAGVDQLAVKLTVAPFTGTVSTPSGAVSVDVTKIIQSLVGIGSSSTSSTSSGSSSATNAAFCKALKQQPKSVQKQFAKQCP